MQHVRHVLPAVGKKFPKLASDLSIFLRILESSPGGFVEMGGEILTCAFETLGLASTHNALAKSIAGPIDRRRALIDAATFLVQKGHRSNPDAIFVAVRMWGTVLARAVGEYGGVASHRRVTNPDRVAPKSDERMSRQAEQLCAFVRRIGMDLQILVSAAEESRALGHEAYLVHLRERHMPTFEAEDEQEAPPIAKSVLPSPQLDLFGAWQQPASDLPAVLRPELVQ